MSSQDDQQTTAGGTAGATPPADGRARSRGRRLLRILASGLLVAGLGFYAGSFLRFAATVAGYDSNDAARADAIVVLTGGSERVKHALALLQAGNAERLLISGVHPETTPQQIVISTASDLSLFSCCVDLDRNANNTLENASETAKWARENGFARLLVVTSAYHMPRALLELRSTMSDFDLVPVPVQTADLAPERWHEEPRTALLLAREHLKYLLAWLRIAVMETSAP
ncbi:MULTISPECIES: YdcF family protein [unclassified Stappia]|uniref:YdcF family protein n=1 Tax=unclassified Stappia TaxID=2629676 RepID=UPI0016491A34|nr:MULTISPECIES: YdcF family protein [unclassified Stappia]